MSAQHPCCFAPKGVSLCVRVERCCNESGCIARIFCCNQEIASVVYHPERDASSGACCWVETADEFIMLAASLGEKDG